MLAKRLWIAGSVCCSLLFFPRSSPAQIKTVTIQPEKPVVNFPATITVTGGMNPCGAVQVNWGSLDDGLAPDGDHAIPITTPAVVEATDLEVGRTTTHRRDGNGELHGSGVARVLRWCLTAGPRSHPQSRR